ncbi:MAG: MBL fold metallo-hydrolase [Candidatus Thorarchaeota archaeon]
MKIERIGQRNITIIYDEPFQTTTHLILGEERVYVCDTFLGPDSMRKVEKVLKKEGVGGMRVVVFNSHADWDHIWGNCYFEGASIIGHTFSRKRVIEEGESELEKWKDSKQGEVTLVPPNLLFENRLYFADDHIEFYHSPGHTIDSSSCYDHKDKVLFVGDNVETDIPYVNSLNFDIYLASLQGYLDKEWVALVTGHDLVQYDDKLVRSNIEYLKQFKEWSVDIKDLSEKALGVHLYALAKLVDQVVERGADDRIIAHYHDALDILKTMEQTEATKKYIDKISMVR